MNCWVWGLRRLEDNGGGKRDARRWWGVRCVRDDVRGSGDCTCGVVGEEGGLRRPVRRGGDDEREKWETGHGGHRTDSQRQRDISRKLIELSIRGETGWRYIEND